MVEAEGPQGPEPFDGTMLVPEWVPKLSWMHFKLPNGVEGSFQLNDNEFIIAGTGSATTLTGVNAFGAMEYLYKLSRTKGPVRFWPSPLMN